MLLVMLVILFNVITCNLLDAMHIDQLKSLVTEKTPFSYNLSPLALRGHTDHADVLLCCHGYGADNAIIYNVTGRAGISEHLLSFNFPDYGVRAFTSHPDQLTFGSIQEILPLLFLMKRIVIDGQATRLCLYGFSAGGGAVVNALAVLHSTRYAQELEGIGITSKHRNVIIDAVVQGYVILDCPLKSIDEIRAFRGESLQFTVFAQRYSKNGMMPLESVKHLPDNVRIILHFQIPDEILSNRDDQLFADRLRGAVTQGVVEVVIGDEGGHNTDHCSLWKCFPAFLLKTRPS